MFLLSCTLEDSAADSAESISVSVSDGCSDNPVYGNPLELETSLFSVTSGSYTSLSKREHNVLTQSVLSILAELFQNSAYRRKSIVSLPSLLEVLV